MFKKRTPFTEGGAGYFIHDDGHMIHRNDVLIVLSIPPDLKKKKEAYGESGAEHFLFKKIINYGDISKKPILGTYTSSSSFSNSSNLRGKISNMLFHCHTHGFWQGGGGVQRSLENGLIVLFRFRI